jgi:ferredoxin--NADP+ reductase
MSQKFIEGRVVGRTDHTDTLFSLQFEAPLAGFIAGQYCQVGLHLPGDDRSAASPYALVMRPYSLVNAPHEHPFEIVLTEVPAHLGGVLTPALHRLQVGDSVYISPIAYGFFSMPEVPDAEVLWGLATGTANGALLSCLKTDALWQKFKKVVLVHAVRTAAELTYRSQIDAIARAYPGRFQYIPFVSREAHDGAMRGRIPQAISDGSLEARAALALNAETAHCMVCGNPEMVADTLAVLKARGLKKHRRKEAGQITTEAYW